MKYAVLDTNFILSCARKKIDFFNEIKFMGLKTLIPLQVIEELKILSGKGNSKLKEEIKLSLNILKNNSFEKIDLHTKNVDNGLVDISEKRDYVIATLDKEIKSRIKNPKLIIRGKKLEII
ncbi:Uncharacterised protein [uncultured archaeon]|nr:Uncharacterised protein [uncultured archaeon]